MKWVAYHNGKRIPYWLGILIGIDQALGAFVPEADIDKTISHRLGVKRVRIAVRQGVVPENLLYKDDSGKLVPHPLRVKLYASLLYKVQIPFRRHPVAALIDRMLERIDPGHSIDAIGA